MKRSYLDFSFTCLAMLLYAYFLKFNPSYISLCVVTMFTYAFLYFLRLIPSKIFGVVDDEFPVQYRAINDSRNTPGGSRFEDEIGVLYTEEIMQTISYFIWDIFEQYNSSERKQVEEVTVFIQDLLPCYDRPDTIALALGEDIYVKPKYLEGYKGNLKKGYTSVLYHEMTHVLQWNAKGHAPEGLIEGIADYVALKSNYDSLGFAEPGQGERWDQGYEITARFLEYCEELRPGFVAGLNRMMRKSYSDDFFVKLMGKPVDQLWIEYKAKYGER